MTRRLLLGGVVLPALLVAGCSAPAGAFDGGARDAPARDGGADAAPRDGSVDARPSLDAAPGDLDAPIDPDAEPGARDGGAGDLDAPVDPDADATDAAPTPLDAAPPDAGPDARRAPRDASFDAAGCGTVVAEHPPVASPHVPACDPVTYGSSPPTSGPHYPSWAAFGVYAAPVPWGFLVHALEHGAIVVAYDCPGGCDAELALLLEHLELRAADPLCARDVHHRVIVVPDPDLGVRFAAAAWGWSLRSDCFDLEALEAFFDAHYAMAPENFCADGATGLTCPPPDAGL